MLQRLLHSHALAGVFLQATSDEVFRQGGNAKLLNFLLRGFFKDCPGDLVLNFCKIFLSFLIRRIEGELFPRTEQVVCKHA